MGVDLRGHLLPLLLAISPLPLRSRSRRGQSAAERSQERDQRPEHFLGSLLGDPVSRARDDHSQVWPAPCSASTSGRSALRSTLVEVTTPVRPPHNGLRRQVGNLSAAPQPDGQTRPPSRRVLRGMVATDRSRRSRDRQGVALVRRREKSDKSQERMTKTGSLEKSGAVRQAPPLGQGSESYAP
jgi:hypothetical protein